MGDTVIESYVANFYCSKDNDIEDFLKKKAILFEKLGKSRTLLNGLLVFHRILHEKEII